MVYDVGSSLVAPGTCCSRFSLTAASPFARLSVSARNVTIYATGDICIVVFRYGDSLLSGTYRVFMCTTIRGGVLCRPHCESVSSIAQHQHCRMLSMANAPRDRCRTANDVRPPCCGPQPDARRVVRCIVPDLVARRAIGRPVSCGTCRSTRARPGARG